MSKSEEVFLRIMLFIVRYLQNSWASSADEWSYCHVDISRSLLSAIKALTITSTGGTDKFPKNFQIFVILLLPHHSHCFSFALDIGWYDRLVVKLVLLLLWVRRDYVYTRICCYKVKNANIPQFGEKQLSFLENAIFTHLIFFPQNLHN